MASLLTVGNFRARPQLPVYEIDPLSDDGWDALVRQHPRSSVFHTRGWLQALARTYGYRPIVFTTSAPGEPLQNAAVFCEVRSWITGRRLVSLPFSDHCDPLVDSAAAEADILGHVLERVIRDGYRYAEVRGRAMGMEEWPAITQWRPSEQFWLHTLPLDAAMESLYRKMHKDCVQRKIRRAEKERLGFEKGRSESLLRSFYQLVLRTRRRHGLPPQPLEWFRNLAESMGDRLTIYLALKGDIPVAALLCLSNKDTVVYKYGSSDERFSMLGGTPFLFWKIIQEAKDQGMRRLDLGRSDLDNDGLVKFKDRLGATKEILTYGRYSAAGTASNLTQTAKCVLALVPDALVAASGRLFYRHMG